MPLLDHFRPPLSTRRPWESFHTTWASALADALNDGVLPSGYIALEHIHSEPGIEIDVATFTESGQESDAGSTATATRTVWTPATAPTILPALFPPSSTVEIHSTEGGRTLVATVELVSPGNKDRDLKRRLFVAKCATYLSRGIGLVVVDVITSRRGNLHNELIAFLGLEASLAMTNAPSLYAVAYRPVRSDGSEQVLTWSFPLAVGEALPVVPLSLAAELCVPLDLETAYGEACRRRRVEEVVE